MKKLIGKLTFPKGAFWDGYEYKLHSVELSAKWIDGIHYSFGWWTLKQNWLGWWVIDCDRKSYTSYDLRK